MQHKTKLKCLISGSTSIIAVLCISTLVSAKTDNEPAIPDDVSTSISSIFDNKVWESVIDMEMLNRQPKWVPENGDDPPLAISRAISLALGEAQRVADLQEGDQFEVVNVMLRSIKSGKHWIYTIGCMRKSEIRTARAFTADKILTIVVLLDASVVTPQVKQ